MNAYLRKIPMNWFFVQGYCECILYLRWVKEIPFHPSAEISSGIRAHDSITLEHDRGAKIIEEPIDQHIKKILEGKEDPASIRGIFVESSKYGLKGEIDELWLSSKEVTIIENKPKEWVPVNIQKQVFGYALAFSDHFKWNGPIICVVYSYNSNKIVWKHTFNDYDRQVVIETAQRIRDILDKKLEPVPTSYPKKCVKCCYLNNCPKSPANDVQQTKLNNPLFYKITTKKKNQRKTK